MTSKSEEKLITVREAAAEYGKNMETVRRWIWSGKLPAQKLGNQLFIKRSDLQSLRLNRRATTQKKTNWPQLMKEVRALREQIRRRAGNFDVTELIRESREDLL